MMVKIKSFTFKNQPKATGLAAVGNRIPNVTIKHNGKIVGWIDSPKARKNECTVYFHVKREPTEDWKSNFYNVQLENVTDNVEDMKAWVKENTESILSKIDVYYRED